MHLIVMPYRMNLLIFLIGLACIIQTGLTQRGVRQGQQCFTPDNYIGECFPLSICPSIANVFNFIPRNDAERYLQIAERNCGNNNIRGEPLVCCCFNQEYIKTTRTGNPFLRINTQPVGVPPSFVKPPTIYAPAPSSTFGSECTGPEFNPGTCTRQQCYTPENGIGQCFTLSNCPSIANLFNIYPRNDAERYLQIAKRNCGNNNFRGDPVVCCGLNQEYTTPTTTRPRNPVFPTNTPPTTLTSPILIDQPPTTTTTTTTTTSTTTTPDFRILSDQQPTETAIPTTTTTPTTSTPTTSTLIPIAKLGEECTAVDNRPGICTNEVECPSLFAQLPQDTTYFSNIDSLFCNKVYTEEVVCCPKAKTNIKKFPRNTIQIPRKLYSAADGCGYVDSLDYGELVIVGGTPSRLGAWPWIALIGYGNGVVSPTSLKCGGALITSRHVLTAAHCIRSDLSFVRLGEHDLSTPTETEHVDVPVVKKVRHPQYNRKDGHNDIGLLYLNQNVLFTEKITPICLPLEPRLRSKNITGLLPYVAGWGKTKEGGETATVLQELAIKVLDNQECKDVYKEEGKYVSEEQFDGAVICAGGDAKDSCQGDSGGPLMLTEYVENIKRMHLIGIVSYSIGCARLDIPGVYTKVANFIEWIENGVADTP